MNILRVVSIASKSGVYGGPFDTAKRQVALAQSAGVSVRLWAGTLSDDEPDCNSIPKDSILVEVRNWLPRLGLASAISLKAARSLMNEIERVEAVHVSFSREMLPLFAAFVAVMKRKRLIVQPHGMLTNRSSTLHRIVDVFVKPLFRAGETIVALTLVEQSALETWIGRGVTPNWLIMGNPVGRLSSGTAMLRTKPLRREALWVARLHPRKRVGDFLAAAALSCENSRDIRFAVVGPDGGDLADVLRAVAGHQDVGYEGAVTSDAVTNRVNLTGVFVLTSRNEPWGNVLATALSLGVPVVVTASTALASEITHFAAGLVVPDESPTELEGAIAKLLDNPILYETSSAGALALSAALLSECTLIQALEGLYVYPK